MVVSNVLCRREGNIIYIPVNPSADDAGTRVLSLFGRAYRLALAQNVISGR